MSAAYHELDKIHRDNPDGSYAITEARKEIYFTFFPDIGINCLLVVVGVVFFQPKHGEDL